MSITHQHSYIGEGVTLLERHYDSQLDLANYVSTSALAQEVLAPHYPLWEKRSVGWTQPTRELVKDHALARAVNRLRGVLDEDCQTSIDAVSAIVRRILERVPSLPSLDVHRKRTTGRSGYAINIHRVNRGQLGTAWKRTVREHRVGQTGVVTLVLCSDYSADADDDIAQYTIGATLALAQKIEATGRRCEIWASILTHNAHRMRQNSSEKTSYLVPGCPERFDELDHLVVKRAGESLSAPTMAALCSLALVRAMFFQVWRMQYATIGTMVNYGSATNKNEVHERLAPYLTRQGIPLESVIMGADESDWIRSIDHAATWVNTTLQGLA